VKNAIDHFMYVGPDLADLNAMFLRLSGIAATPGGQHPTMGTHNSLVGGRDATYLELLAPDPSATVDSPIRRNIAAVPRPQLHKILLKSTRADFPALIAAYARAGITARTQPLQRRTPAGETLRWQLLIPEDNAYGVFTPWFIDWLESPHPTTRLQAELNVLGCTAGHPDAPRLAPLWQDLGVDIPLHTADAPYLHVRLGTPRGELVLTSG